MSECFITVLFAQANFMRTSGQKPLDSQSFKAHESLMGGVFMAVVEYNQERGKGMFFHNNTLQINTLKARLMCFQDMFSLKTVLSKSKGGCPLTWLYHHF